jgi:hypothetical protein
VIQRGRSVEHDECRTEDRTSDDVPCVAAQAGRHDEDHEAPKAKHEAQAVREHVGDLLADAVERFART